MKSGADTARTRTGDLAPSPLVPAHELGEIGIRGWYEIVRRMPSACGCDAELVVLPEPLEIDDLVLFGSFNAEKNLMSCAILPNPYETLATLLHEVAHFAANPRHRRHHGYSWRWQYIGLASDLLGVNVLPLARDFRRRYLADHGEQVCKASALDFAVQYALTTARPTLTVGEGSVSAAVGGRVLKAPRWSGVDPLGDLVRRHARR